MLGVDMDHVHIMLGVNVEYVNKLPVFREKFNPD